MRRYETIYILRPTLGEEAINTIIENTNKIVTDDGGVIIELDRWGMRKLAYPIEKEIQGFYVFCDYAGTPEALSEIERKFRIDDSVLRYMSIKIADSLSDEDVENAKGEVVARKAAATETQETDVTEVKEVKDEKKVVTEEKAEETTEVKAAETTEVKAAE